MFDQVNDPPWGSVTKTELGLAVNQFGVTKTKYCSLFSSKRRSVTPVKVCVANILHVGC